MEARTHCRSCYALLVLTHKDGRWSLRCPKDGGFVNVTPGEHTLPASYADDCQLRAATPTDFDLTDEQGELYEGAAALKRAYLQEGSTSAAPSAS